MGELYGAYNFQSVLNNIWYSIQELTNQPEGIATRQLFLSNVSTFLTKAQEVYTGLVEYQQNLDDQIREMVNGANGINATVAEIARLTEIIRTAEAGGDKANDYRDQRHLLLDHLSSMIPTDVYEGPTGELHIMSMGHHLLSGSYQSVMGLRYISNEIAFVEPVFTSSKQILSAGTPSHEFTSYIDYGKPISAASRNDSGTLLALMQARGTIAATHLSAHAEEPVLIDQAIADAAALAVGAASTNFLADLRAAALAAPGNAALQTALAHAERDPNNFLARYAAATGNAALQTEIMREIDRDYSAQMHNHRAAMWSIENAMIPQTQMNIDRIVNKVATMINDALTGNLRDKDGEYLFYQVDANGDPVVVPGVIDPITGNPQRIPIRPVDNGGDLGIPLFIRNSDAAAGPPYTWPITDDENPNIYATIFSINNIKINPAFLQAGGHNLLALSLGGAPGDTDLLVELQKVWMSGTGHYAVEIGDREFNIQDAYIRMTGIVATEIAEANSKVSSSMILTDQADNMRNAIKGVSMDEEMNAMLRFQFAFQAASRVFNMIDSMIDRIVNGTGRVGL
jgi:flagellar hook-associated protein 1 FlgK